MTKYVLLLITLLLLFVFIFCSKSTAPVEIPDTVTLEQILVFQDSYSQKYKYYLDYFDSTEALEAVFNFIAADTTLVESVDITEQGLAVVYTTGLRGGMLIDPGDNYEAHFTQGQNSIENSKALPKPADITPNSKRSLFLCPIYQQRWKTADSISMYAHSSITKAGYQGFNKKLGIECGISAFIHLYNYGLIHIYTFNFNWYQDNAFTDVYLMTGDVISDDLNTLYDEDLSNQDIAIINVPGYGNLYFIRPAMLTDVVELGSERPLIYLGYGNSLNSGWPESLKTGACIGYDGQVDAIHNIKWAKDFYSAMSDTAQFKQITIQDWYSTIETFYTDNSYDPPRQISIEYEGTDDFVLWQSLRVTEIIPEMGFVGDTIAIHGIGFGNDQSDGNVLIGDQTAEIVSWSDTLITLIVPEDATQDGLDITVRDINYQNVAFYVMDRIAILDITPERAYWGDLISIHGFGFGDEQGNGYILLGGYEFDEIQYWSDTLIQTYIASWVKNGNAQVIAQNNESNLFDFSLITEITLNSITPAAGKSGETVILRGTNLGYDPGYVYFGNTRVSGSLITFWSDTAIDVVVPNIIEYGQMKVKVVSHGLTSNEKIFFKQTYSTISSITPNDVGQLDTITISGSGFGDEIGNSKVEIITVGYIRGKEAEIVSWSDTKIRSIVPLLVSTGKVYVVRDGNYSNGFDFTIFGIDQISSAVGIPGTLFEIYGAEFGDNQNNSEVTLNEIPIEIRDWQDYRIKCKLPAGVSSGDLIVIVNNRTTPPYHYKVPRIFDITPKWVAPGMMVTINGVDFGYGRYPVYFHGGPSEYVEWSDTLVVAQVPESAMSGSVQVRAYGLRGPNSDPIEVLDITYIDPLFGLPGDTVDIYGTGFFEYFGNNYVTLNDMEMPVVDWSNTLITAIIPPEADSGQIVVHVDGYASIAEEFVIVELDDLFDLLFQAAVCETKFSGAMAFDNQEPIYTELIVKNTGDYTGKWIVDSFEYGPVVYYPYDINQHFNAGKIETDGSMILNQKTGYNYYWEMTGGGAWSIYMKDVRFDLYNIPFESIVQNSDTTFIKYALYGSESINHIDNISTYVYQYSGMHDEGVGWYSWQYQSTDWENEQYPPAIEVIFKIPNYK